jgi:hypothetical protein
MKLFVWAILVFCGNVFTADNSKTDLITFLKILTVLCFQSKLIVVRGGGGNFFHDYIFNFSQYSYI